jgi:hypothetical protein
LWENRARLSLLLGEQDAYRQAFAAALRRFPDSVWLPYYGALGPGAGIEPKQLVRLADQAVRKAPTNYLSLVAAGSARYRAGDFEEAVKRLTLAGTSIPEGNGSQVWFFLAMAHHCLGHADQARQELSRAVWWQEWKLRESAEDLSVLPWYLRVEMQLLRREAEALIQAKPAPETKNPSEAK